MRLVGPAILLAAFLASCNTTKYLAPNQELLVSQRVKIEKGATLTNRADITYELSTIAKQQPNGNFLFLWPREYFYLDNDKPRDTTRIDRFLRRTIGQEPAIYSDSLSRRSVAAMTDYLRYLGYFNATAYHEADRGKKRKVNLIYHIQPGRRFIIDSVVFASPDPLIDSLLEEAQQETLLVSGEPLDLNKFDQEKARLGNYLNNHGYAFFTATNFDKLEIDTSRRSGYADVFFNVLPPEQEENYKRYRVGEILVLTDVNPLAIDRGTFLLDTIIDGVRFASDKKEFKMRPELLRKNIFLKPGELFKRENLEKTRLSLNGLGIYRFVRINSKIEGDGSEVINYQIQLTPSERMSVGADLDVSYTDRSGPVRAGNLVGLSVRPSFQNRNLLGGAELLVTSLRAGVEINPGFGSRRGAFFNTIDLGADVSLYLPRFKDFGFYRLMNKLPAPWGGKMVSDGLLSQLRERANTRYSLGYEYLLIRNFYSYTIFNASLGYDFRRSATTRYRINHLAINILDPVTEPQFNAILRENQFLERSFGEQYFFSVLFRNIEYSRVGRSDHKGRSITFNGQFEVAGAEVSALNGLLNVFREDDTILTPKQGATFSKYYLGIADVRFYKNYTPLSSFATRFLAAAAKPFDGNDEVPYVKQFFVGGANSMRAWAPRGLGPGGYVDTLSLDTDNNLRLFQTGDLRLELNLEYRFPIASFFRGAIFADIGNIWTLDDDEDGGRPGSKFRLRKELSTDGSVLFQPFYRQLAIAAGTGIRVDLSYFIFRLDAAVPLRYNYPNDGFGEPLDRDSNDVLESDYWSSFRGFRLRDITFQLGLGYPF
ncbi:Surface antigen [Neolewinella agarilytica]|uniref:Surface antigen n=1 Tax=Neolewinella agarilytica TaxID=478744 RepID=A0A1H9BHY4_9BACT|nr:Surface antigen [Neolewinella agarilytica]